jgi:EipB-like
LPGESESDFMIMRISVVAAATVCATAVLLAESRSVAAPAADPGELAAHRAIYELKLAPSRGQSSSAMSARGRILYDFSGSACEGYKLEFRQVSELDNGEGRVTLSDLRTNSWEDGAANSYTFNSQNYVNQRLVDAVDGRADRAPNAVAVTLSKPTDRKLTLDHAVIFPSEHVRRIIEAARAGRSILEFPVYDGSETGDKVYNTLTVIGHEIAPNQRVPNDAAAGQAALANMKRWPITVSYFDTSKKAAEQMPVYSISFELYENGISRALLLDYNDFAINGELTSLDIKEAKPCP